MAQQGMLDVERLVYLAAAVLLVASVSAGYLYRKLRADRPGLPRLGRRMAKRLG